MKFPAQDVVRIFQLLEDGGVPVWLEGGWGIDALLKRETRAHRDVDIIVPLDHLAAAESELGKAGFLNDERETSMPTRYVLRNSEGLAVDIHPVTFEPDGTAVHIHADVGGLNDAYAYSPLALSGVGVVSGRVVPCTTAAEQIRQRLRYSPWCEYRIRERGVSADLEDISLLLQALGVYDGMVAQTATPPGAQPTSNPVADDTEPFLLRRVASLIAQHSRLTAQHVELTTQHAELRARHAELSAQINALWASTSWQLTAPMRWIVERWGLDWRKLRTQ